MAEEGVVTNDGAPEGAAAASGAGAAGAAGAGASGASAGAAEAGAAGAGAGAGQGAAAAGEAAKIEQNWRDDWREALAAGDDKMLKQLHRYSSPADVWKKTRELETKLSSGDYKRGLAKDATPEEVTAWRKENGIPESVDGYKLPDAIAAAIDEADKPKVAAFFEHMHSKNYTPEQANDWLGYYAKVEQDAVAARQEKDLAVLDETKGALIAEWGLPDYRKNVSLINGTFLSQFSDESRELIASARLADGTPFMSHPDVVKGLAAVVREMNPAATVAPNSAKPMADIAARKGEIKAMMAKRDSDYWQGPKAATIQAEYAQLLEAEEKMAKRVA